MRPTGASRSGGRIFTRGAAAASAPGSSFARKPLGSRHHDAFGRRKSRSVVGRHLGPERLADLRDVDRKFQRRVRLDGVPEIDFDLVRAGRKRSKERKRERLPFGELSRERVAQRLGRSVRGASDGALDRHRILVNALAEEGRGDLGGVRTESERPSSLRATRDTAADVSTLKFLTGVFSFVSAVWTWPLPGAASSIAASAPARIPVEASFMNAIIARIRRIFPDSGGDRVDGEKAFDRPSEIVRSLQLRDAHAQRSAVWQPVGVPTRHGSEPMERVNRRSRSPLRSR